MTSAWTLEVISRSFSGGLVLELVYEVVVDGVCHLLLHKHGGY
jgi:hypothetical protein